MVWNSSISAGQISPCDRRGLSGSPRSSSMTSNRHLGSAAHTSYDRDHASTSAASRPQPPPHGIRSITTIVPRQGGAMALPNPRLKWIHRRDHLALRGRARDQAADWRVSGAGRVTVAESGVGLASATINQESELSDDPDEGAVCSKRPIVSSCPTSETTSRTCSDATPSCNDGVGSLGERAAVDPGSL